MLQSSCFGLLYRLHNPDILWWTVMLTNLWFSDCLRFPFLSVCESAACILGSGVFTNMIFCSFQLHGTQTMVWRELAIFKKTCWAESLKLVGIGAICLCLLNSLFKLLWTYFLLFWRFRCLEIRLHIAPALYCLFFIFTSCQYCFVFLLSSHHASIALFFLYLHIVPPLHCFSFIFTLYQHCFVSALS